MEIYLCAVGIQDSGNLGALARLCNNFDLKGLILVDSECEVDNTAYQRATRGRRYLDNAIQLDSLEEIRQFADVLVALTGKVGSKRKLGRTTVTLDDAVTHVSGVEGSVAIILGRESIGLNSEELLKCDISATIPVSEENPILNISHAAAIALYSFCKQPSKSSARPMTAAERKALLQRLETLLHLASPPHHHSSLKIILHGVVGRALVTRREANGIIGFLNAVINKLSNETNP